MAPRRAGQPFRRMGKQGTTSYGPRKTKTVDASTLRNTEVTSQNEKAEAVRFANEIDESMGFPRYDSGKKKVGWLCNMHSTTIEDENVPGGKAGVDYYFIGEDGDTFKATLEYDPYFLIAVKKGREPEVEEYCRRAFEGLVKTAKKVEKEDLSMPNHLTGYRRTFLQLSFANVNDLLAVRKALAPIVEKNKKNVNALDTYAEVARYVL
jgi:DNA polymerase epsilon subunit 1